MVSARPFVAAALVAAFACTTPCALADSPTEAAAESQLLDIITSQGPLHTTRMLNQHSHYAGTPGDRALAYWMRDRLEEDGFDATIEPFTTLVYTPKKLVLQLMSNPRVDFNLREGRIASDPDGSRPDAGLPFNAGSASADITKPVVYAAAGMPNDYAALAKAGVEVRGKILLVRYGAEFRGALAARAQANGAAGVLFYNDPVDLHAAPYPAGAGSPLVGTQRGTVDGPLRIPVLPVTGLTAQRILQTIHGKPSPRAFRGKLDASYDYGQSSSPVHMNVQMVGKMTTLWNTVGTIVGKDPAQSVILGAHRDAWVYGATDNGSGISTELEAARALGYLHKSGWQPERSIVVVGWDGEEIGERGSAQYVDAHRADLLAGCIAYINADEVTTGQRFASDAVAALAPQVKAAARVVRDPHNVERSLLSKWRAQKGGAVVEEPGGGSDFESFLYTLGTPILEVGFYGPFGVYHSAYDDTSWALKFGDPTFANHRAEAQLLALFTMRFAQDEVLPYDFADYAPLMRMGLGGLAKTAKDPDALQALSRAVNRFAGAAAAFDARPNPNRNADAFAAVKELDLLVYGASGYGSVAFPKLAQALAAGNASAQIAAAVATIDDATNRLK
jgi:N-acetylated-alpha-linked acidic dipeptidase